MKLRIEYECTSSTGGGKCPGQGDSRWPDYEPRYETNVVRAIYKTGEGDQLYSDSADQEEENIEVGDRVFLVVVTYSDGDTFSSSHGHLTFPGVFKDKTKAISMASRIKNDKYVSPKGYCCWKGYFSSLEGVEIHEMTVQAGSDSGADDTDRALKGQWDIAYGIKIIRHFLSGNYKS